MPSYTVQTGRNRPAYLGLAQPLGLVAQHDGNRGRRSATVVGDSGKPAPEVGGEQVLWQGGGMVDRFEVKKRSDGGSPELPTMMLAADGEPAAEARTGGRGGRRLGRELRGAAPELGDGSTMSSKGPGWCCTVVPQWWHDGAVGGGGRRREKGSFLGVGLPL
jgi:hypothetical protein